jgi:hypothetical protein
MTQFSNADSEALAPLTRVSVFFCNERRGFTSEPMLSTCVCNKRSPSAHDRSPSAHRPQPLYMSVSAHTRASTPLRLALADVRHLANLRGERSLSLERTSGHATPRL